MKKITLTVKHLVAVVLLLAVASSAWALNLQEAKSAGLVKETAMGYLEVVDVGNNDVSGLVKDVNEKRKSKYSEIAKRNNISLQAVEKQAGKKLMR